MAERTRRFLTKIDPLAPDSKEPQRLDQAKKDAASPRRSRRLLLGLLACVLLAGAAFGSLPGAWRATVLREAYLPDLEAMAQKDRFNAPLLSLLGARLAEAHEYAPAATALETAISAGNNEARLWLTWAASLAAAGDRAKALAALRFGMQQSALTPALRPALQRAETVQADAPPAALAAAISPEGPGQLADSLAKGSFLNGLATWRAGREPEQSGFSTRKLWAAERPNDALAQRLWGVALDRNRRYAEAEPVLQHALELDAKSAATHLALGDNLVHRNNLGKAGLEYVAALKLKPNWLPGLLGLGHVALEKKLITISLDVFTRATQQAPNNDEAWIGLGRAYYNQKFRLDKSLEAFERAVRLNPNRTDFYTDYSNALRQNFQMGRAETALRKRVTLTPEDARAHYLLALILLDYQPSPARETEAEKEMRVALQYEPNSTSTKIRLGRLLIERGNTREAIGLLESALREDRYSEMARRSLGRAYQIVGRTQDSEAMTRSADALAKYVQRTVFLEDLLQRQPLDIKTHLELASLYTSGGETDKAKSHYDMAYMLKTQPKAAVKGIQALRDSTSIVVPPGR